MKQINKPKKSESLGDFLRALIDSEPKISSICGEFHKVNTEGGSKLSSFSRKHYRAIAELIKNAETKYQVAQDLAKMFAEDNDRFDYQMFFKACGILL